MIEKLDIKNFMTFETLHIPQLKQVNLITGKNNCGKTALLEAIRIYVSEGENTVINHILKNRNVFQQGWEESYEALFNRNKNGSRELNINEHKLSRLDQNDVKKYRYEFYNEKNIFPTLNISNSRFLSSTITSDNPKDKAIYIPFFIDYVLINKLWENIVLTPKEDDVIYILQETIEPDILRFDVGINQVKVRLKNIEKPVPLKTLGDGVQRILLLALSLANAKNGYLLIDEIELGLHHTVMEKLWELIFKYAKDWNIQVFATTHSLDAVKTFYYVASEEMFKKNANFIRLQTGRTGKKEAILYDMERLEDVFDLTLEIR